MVVLFLLVPFLIARITVAILEATYPRASSPAPGNRNARPATLNERLDQIEADIDVHKKGLERARAITRIAFVVIGIYYVVLISGWIILRRRKRKLLRA